MYNIGILILFVYSLVETLEIFGLSKKTAHLLSIPLGLISSFLLLQGTLKEHIFQGLVIGIGAVGTCDTSCNIVDWVKSRMIHKVINQ